MSEIFKNPLFGITLTAAVYCLTFFIYKKTKLTLLHPLPVSLILICAVLILTGIPYESYNNGGKYITYLLTPATALLAVPLYDNRRLLYKNAGTVLFSLSAGAVTALLSVFLLCKAFGFDDIVMYSMLPKSATVPIAREVTGQLGGIEAITILSVFFAGLTGTLFGNLMSKAFKINDNLSKGLAMGSASHILGTSKLLETNSEAGAAGSVAVVIAGLITLISAPWLLRLFILIFG